jgi:hypothetical protein
LCLRNDAGAPATGKIPHYYGKRQKRCWAYGEGTGGDATVRRKWWVSETVEERTHSSAKLGFGENGSGILGRPLSATPHVNEGQAVP